MKQALVLVVLGLIVLAGPGRTWAGSGGDLDPTFGSGGVVTTSFGGPYTLVSGLVIQPDGRIVAVGGSNGRFAVARYSPDGTLDFTFGAGGTVLTPMSTDSADYAFADDVALQSDGKLVAVGSVGPADKFGGHFAVARYTAGGVLDPTFGNAGAVITNFGSGALALPTQDVASAVAVQPDGKIVVVGVSWDSVGPYGNLALARYNPDGSLDSTFGVGGLVRRGGPIGGWARAVVLQPDGKIVVAGSVQLDYAMIARFKADGSLDTSFGNGGVTQFGQYAEAYSLLVQPDGKLVAAGGQYVYPPSFEGSPIGRVMLLARCDVNGQFDATFGNHGIVTTSFQSPWADAFGVVLQPDNRLVAAGRLLSDAQASARHFGLARYNTDGSLDSSFGSNGTVEGPDGEAYALVGVGNGDVVAAGNVDTSGQSFRLARYTNLGCGNGKLDAGEACDDGNRIDGDDCDSNCTFTACGNGIVTAGEACDDGNLLDTDTCTSKCALNVCGDGLTNAETEECDDGNAVNGDGCDKNCKVTACGNGIVTSGEECDDGNLLNGDGCDSSCRTERCGDQRLEGDEQCDDGNTADGDACSSVCRWSLVYDEFIRPIKPMSIRLGSGDSTRDVVVKPSLMDVLPVPAGHKIVTVVADGDCPAGTASVDADGQVQVHVASAAFPAASSNIPQRCTFVVSARIQPPDAGDATPENNDAPLELNVYARGPKAPGSAFSLESLSPVKVIVPYRRDTMTRPWSLRSTPQSLLRDGAATLIARDGTCPTGTVRIEQPAGRARVLVTATSAAVRSQSNRIPARCTALVTATVPGVASENQHTTHVIVEMVDANDF